MSGPVQAQRDAHGRLLPGFSGNPSGRPRVVKEIRELARQYVPAALKKIGELVGSEDERVALAASQEILNRVFGRPLQSVESDVRKFDMGALYLAALKSANGNPADVVDVTPATDQLADDVDGPAPDLIAMTNSDGHPVEW